MPKTHTIPCTKEEIDRLLDYAMIDEFMYMIFFVAKTTGRRLGEYYGVFNKETKEWEGGVQVKDINFEAKTMDAQVLKRRKRVVKQALLTDETARIIKQYILKHKLKLDDYLFRKYSYRHIQHLTTKMARDAGITHKVTFHNFRHYLISHLVKKNWDYSKIAKITGHGNLGTLVLYDHVVAKDIQDDAMRDLEGI